RDPPQEVGTAGRRHRRRLQALLRRARGQAPARERAEDRAEVGLRGDARDRPRPRGRVDQLAPAPGAEAESAGQAHRLPRDHEEGDRPGGARSARRRRQPGPGAGKPAHSRSALRLHALAGAVEEGADRAERRPRAERRRAADRRSRRRAARLSHRSLFRPRGAVRRRRPQLRGNADPRRRHARRHRQGLRRQRRAGRQERAPAVGRRRGEAGRRARAAPAVHGGQRRSEAGRRTAGGAVHHVDADAGSEPQARFSTQRTMQAAQRLFQEGHISYHRTDSTTLSEEALGEAGRAIRGLFGDEFYTGPRRYSTQVKNAQEAHEAIRPTEFGVAPQALDASGDDLRVYELIWKRTMASQMPDARVLRTTIEIAGTGDNGEKATFTASGKAIEFAGFRRAYVEGSDDIEAELADQETLLPAVTVGETIDRTTTRVRLTGLEAKGHDTSP